MMTMSTLPADSDPTKSPPPPSAVRSLTPRNRSRRWRHSRTSTSIIVLLSLIIATSAWFSLVFSNASWPHLHNHHLQLHGWEGGPLHHHPSDDLSSPPPPPPPPPPPSATPLGGASPQHLSLNHLVFGIASSAHLWNRRKHFVKLWWRPGVLRGHVWLEEPLPDPLSESEARSLPEILLSEDISRFRYTNPTGHPSGLRISRIVAECFRLGLPDVRWFVLGDDDTIFNVDNLVTVLSKYDYREMVYIGGPSESHSANVYFSHTMAFGGGGIAISYPLAEALSKMQDECLERYPKLYGSDDRLHACILELGVPLTREYGFHQWDIRGSAHGLLTSHPIAPFISIHHVEAVNPFYPGMTSLDSLKLFVRAMRADPKSFLQRAICYDHKQWLTFAVSLGYVVQVFPNIVLPRELERTEHTFSAWNRISSRNEFDFDTRDAYRSVCKKPIMFFLKDVKRDGNLTVGSYGRTKGRDDLKRKVFCFPRALPLQGVMGIKVLGNPLSDNWHLVPRRLCCQVNQTSDKHLEVKVGQCERGISGSIVDSV